MLLNGVIKRLVRRSFGARGANCDCGERCCGGRAALDPPWAARPPQGVSPGQLTPAESGDSYPAAALSRASVRGCPPHAPGTSHSEKPLTFGKVSRPAAPLDTAPSAPPQQPGAQCGRAGARRGLLGAWRGSGALLRPPPRQPRCRALPPWGCTLQAVVWVLQDMALPVGKRNQVFTPPKDKGDPSRGHEEPGTDLACRTRCRGDPGDSPSSCCQ